MKITPETGYMMIIVMLISIVMELDSILGVTRNRRLKNKRRRKTKKYFLELITNLYGVIIIGCVTIYMAKLFGYEDVQSSFVFGITFAIIAKTIKGGINVLKN